MKEQMRMVEPIFDHIVVSMHSVLQRMSLIAPRDALLVKLAIYSG